MLQNQVLKNLLRLEKKLKVGDSRRGWVDSYQKILELSSDNSFKSKVINTSIDLKDVRPAGESLKGFGGMANPVKLKDLYPRVANLLNKAVGRKLTFSRKNIIYIIFQLEIYLEKILVIKLS